MSRARAQYILNLGPLCPHIISRLPRLCLPPAFMLSRRSGRWKADYERSSSSRLFTPSVTNAVLTLRPNDLRSQQPLRVPLSFATRVDMEPDVMGDDDITDHSVPVENAGASYRFATDLRWKRNADFGPRPRCKASRETVSGPRIVTRCRNEPCSGNKLGPELPSLKWHRQGVPVCRRRPQGLDPARLKR